MENSPYSNFNEDLEVVDKKRKESATTFRRWVGAELALLLGEAAGVVSTELTTGKDTFQTVYMFVVMIMILINGINILDKHERGKQETQIVDMLLAREINTWSNDEKKILRDLHLHSAFNSRIFSNKWSAGFIARLVSDRKLKMNAEEKLDMTTAQLKDFQMAEDQFLHWRELIDAEPETADQKWQVLQKVFNLVAETHKVVEWYSFSDIWWSIYRLSQGFADQKIRMKPEVSVALTEEIESISQEEEEDEQLVYETLHDLTLDEDNSNVEAPSYLDPSAFDSSYQ